MILRMSPDLSSKNRRNAIRNFKIYCAVHHEVFISKDDEDIARAINITVKRLQNWRRCYALVFESAFIFWQARPILKAVDPKEKKMLRSLRAAKDIWTEMIENGYNFRPSDMDNFLRDHTYLKSEGDAIDNQIGLEALKPPPRFIWVHDITAVIFAIGSII